VRERLPAAALAFALLDLTAVSVMLPTLRTDLGSSPSGGQWIVNAYLLGLAVVLPLARSAPVDRRRLTAAGALVMAAGAVVSATAGSTSALVAGLALQGAGLGALVAPVVSGAAALVPLAALALGPLVGGAVAEQNWWHLWFWAGVPAAALLAVVAPRAQAPEPLDRRVLAIVAALVALTVVLVQAEPWGLERGLVDVIGLLAVVLVAWGAVPPLLGVAATAGGALAALCFLMPQYLELAHLIHPLRSGVWLAALTIPGVAAGVLARRMRPSGSPALLVTAGALAAAVGALTLGWLEEDSSEALIGAGLLLCGAGFGFAAGASDEARRGDPIVSAAVGATLTLAVAGAMFQYGQADLRASGESFQHSLSRGVGQGVLLLAPLAAAMAAGCWRARRAASAARPAAES
jgi:MFS transporter, DHA2 family, methylenomycin A resistance protein